MAYLLGVLTGFFIAYYVHQLMRKLKPKDGCRFHFLGYDVSLTKPANKNVVNLAKTKKAASPKDDQQPTKDVCDFCQGEDIYVKGTKHIMMCPKCERNKNKIKRPTSRSQ